MPRRAAKQYEFEAETERRALTPRQEQQLLKIAVDRASADLAEWHQADSEIDKFYAAPRAAMAAYTLRDYALAREIANISVTLAASFEDNWNYGNAIHFGNTVLGLLALVDDDTCVAIEHLRKSGETSGSPQLNSFGPTMHLARELMRKGESAAVAEYLEQCRRFWKMGSAWLDIWQEKVARGAVPTFFMHLYR
jgi:hypothetical protein